jgi:integrase/recombinase XerD
MGHLCERMRRDMTIANYSPHTITIYLLYGKLFAKHFMRSPEEMGTEEIKAFLLHCFEVKHYSFSSYRQCYAALKYLYTITLGRPFEVERLQFPRQETRLPVVLSGTEVEALFDATHDLRFRTIFQTLYATGLRVSEVCRLEVADIDSQRMMVRVRQGKGNTDRYVPLSPKLLALLRAYYRACRPQGPALFPGGISAPHVSADSVRHALRKAALDAGICKDVTPHILRHTYATHLLEAGADVTVVQKLLGHALVKTTMIYLQISQRHLNQARIPLDLLGTPDGAVLG